MSTRRDAVIQAAINVWSGMRNAGGVAQQVLFVARAIWSMDPSGSDEPTLEHVKEYIGRPLAPAADPKLAQ